MAKLKVTLKRSLISRPETQRKTVRSLGLHRINSFSILPDVPTIRGQIFKVKHLVAVEEISDDDAAKFEKKSVKIEKKAEAKVEPKVEVKAETKAEVKVEAKAVADKAVNEERVAAKAKKIIDAVKGPSIAEKVVKDDAKKSEEA